VRFGEQIESPALGLRVTWREVAEDVLAFDLAMRAGAPVIPMHVHPRQEERITVLTGAIRSRSGAREQLLRAGDAVVTPAGEAHTIEPADRGDAEVRAELRPALHYGEFIERSFALDRAGHVNAQGRANPLRAALTGPAEAEFFIAGPPVALQKPILRLLAALGRAFGYADR
jgi:mannose-6-phosphate isomerase-like protein (cupin superfamily)